LGDTASARRYRDIFNRLEQAWRSAGQAKTLLFAMEAAERNPTQARQLLLDACEKTSFRHPAYLDLLAICYSQLGQFEDSLKYGQMAFDKAFEADRSDVAARLRQYRRGEPVYSGGIEF
jgi:hypothetical protein